VLAPESIAIANETTAHFGIEEVGPGYKQLFSENNERRMDLFLVETSVMANLDSVLRIYLTTRFLRVFSSKIGIGVDSSTGETIGTTISFPFWFFEYNHFGIYMPLGWHDDNFFIGVGTSIPIGKKTDLRLEYENTPDDDKWIFTGGLSYRLW